MIHILVTRRDPDGTETYLFDMHSEAIPLIGDTIIRGDQELAVVARRWDIHERTNMAYPEIFVAESTAA